MIVIIVRLIIVTNIFDFVCRAEIPPPPQCPIDKPFMINSEYCSNFNEICVKTGDQQCENFKSACQQCPPSNYSVIMFQDILYLKKRMDLKMDLLKDDLKINKIQLQNFTDLIKNISTKINVVKKISITNISLLFLLIVILILEIRFKLITKLFCINFTAIGRGELPRSMNYSARAMENKLAEKGGYTILKSRKLQKINEEISSSIRIVKNEIKPLIWNSTTDHRKMKFLIPKDDFILELYINDNDNVVKLKRQISDKIERKDSNSYKTMKMKYKGNQLDNNQYLLSCIDSPEIPIYCEYDNDGNNIIDINEIIIVKLNANFHVPDMLEIKSSQTIGQLKEIISTITHLAIEDFVIMKQLERLDIKKTVNDCGLSDNDWIQIKKTNGTVSFQSIFHDDFQYECQYCLQDKVSSLKAKLKEKLNSGDNNLTLFTNGNYLSGDDFLYKYNLDGDILIKYCDFNYRDIYETVKSLHQGGIEYFLGKHKITKENILIKTYDTSIYVKNSDIHYVSEDLQFFMRIKSHSRFIQLLDVYFYNEQLYLAMDNVHGVSLSDFLNNRENLPINNYKIAKWTKQILEGLTYIHQYGLVYKDLNPFNIFIDGYNNVKLPSFNSHGYFDSIMTGITDEVFNKITPNIFKYISPEIIKKEKFEKKADLFSLGAILIRICTYYHPYPGLGNKEIFEMMKSNQNLNFKTQNISEILKKFIKLCYVYEVNERASIDQLLQIDLLKKDKS